MSYEKNISNYIVKFKDEKSYLEAKLENLKSFPDIPFIGFLRNEMYNKDNCEIESIEPYSINFNGEGIAVTGPIAEANTFTGNSITYGVDTITGNLINYDVGSSPHWDNYFVDNYTNTPIGYIVNTDYSFGSDYTNITVYNNGTDVWKLKIPKKEKKKKEPPDEPINNRFDILDL